VASSHSDQERREIQEIIALLEEKRNAFMKHDAAGYFIREWREIGDQVRRMIADDPRYQQVQAVRKARRDSQAAQSTHAV